MILINIQTIYNISQVNQQSIISLFLTCLFQGDQQLMEGFEGLEAGMKRTMRKNIQNKGKRGITVKLKLKKKKKEAEITF